MLLWCGVSYGFPPGRRHVCVVTGCVLSQGRGWLPRVVGERVTRRRARLLDSSPLGGLGGDGLSSRERRVALLVRRTLPTQRCFTTLYAVSAPGHFYMADTRFAWHICMVGGAFWEKQPEAATPPRRGLGALFTWRMPNRAMCG